MNKISLLLILSFCIWGCNNSHTKKTNIEGEIKGLGNDTIYLYGTDDLSSFIDTIYANGDKFSHSLSVDTLTSGKLLFNGQTEIPIFLNKGDKIAIKGEIKNLKDLQISGNTFNEELSKFEQTIAKEQSKSIIKNKAEEFIKKHHSSIVSTYLLKKYFLLDSTPNLNKIEQLISTMDGKLQDVPMISAFKAYINEAQKLEIGKEAPFFSLPNQENKRISLLNIKNKYVLIHFWASWSDSCQQVNHELRKIYKAYKKKKNFTMIGISLDVDKKAWKQSIKKDTLSWQQVCDFSGWECAAIKQYAVESLPYYYLISPKRKILLKEQNYKELKTKLQEIVK